MMDYPHADFNKAFNKAKLQAVFARLHNANPQLLSLYEVTKLIKPMKETYLGIKPIKVSKIIGSESRYSDFSLAFMPKNYKLRGRWQSIEKANERDIILPPISVFKVGNAYFVRDGNHRVSVAKTMGIEFIDAEIVELDSKIKLHPGMTTKQIASEVVQWERERFLAQYDVSNSFPISEIRFTSIGSYPELINHILVHKYYINQDRDYEISFQEAAKSWYEHVYCPITESISKEHMQLYFPGKTKSDLYLWIVRHWDNLKKETNNNDLSIQEASIDYEKRFGKGLLKNWIKWLKGKFVSS